MSLNNRSLYTKHGFNLLWAKQKQQAAVITWKPGSTAGSQLKMFSSLFDIFGPDDS